MEKTYKYSTGAYAIAFRNLILALGALIFFATVFGQIKAGRFPAYLDLGLSLLIPICCYLFIVALIYICSFFYTVRLTDERIFGSNAYGFFLSSKYGDIKDAYTAELNGFAFIVIETNSNKSSIYVPIWLKEFDEFCNHIKQVVPEENPLAKLINEST